MFLLPSWLAIQGQASACHQAATAAGGSEGSATGPPSCLQLAGNSEIEEVGSRGQGMAPGLSCHCYHCAKFPQPSQLTSCPELGWHVPSRPPVAGVRGQQPSPPSSFWRNLLSVMKGWWGPDTKWPGSSLSQSSSANCPHHPLGSVGFQSSCVCTGRGWQCWVWLMGEGEVA